MIHLPQHSKLRHVAMKDSRSHVNDRRDRGRVDRRVAGSRVSLSPTSHRQGDRTAAKIRDHSPLKFDSAPHYSEKSRERSYERRRRNSRSPHRDPRELVRERNRGRELLDTQSSHKHRKSNTHPSPPSGKRRRTSRTPSPSRSHTTKPKRGISRSPRFEGRFGANSQDRQRKEISPTPPRKRSFDRSTDIIDSKSKRHRASAFVDKFGRSPSPRPTSHRDTYHRFEPSPKRARTLNRKSHKPRDRSPVETYKSKGHRREEKEIPRGRSPEHDTSNYSRHVSPRAPRGPKNYRGGHSPRREGRGGRVSRDESRSIDKSGNSVIERGRSFGGHRDNSIEIKSSRTPAAASASGVNSIEVRTDKMAGRGYYGSQHGYNPHHQMQAAFPLKPQFNQGPQQIDPRQYSQSPQHHLTPGSYHGSPALSPYPASRGNWGGHTPHQYSPPP